MGLRFSKTAANNIAAKATKTNTSTVTSEQQQQPAFSEATNIIPIPDGGKQFVGPTINLQIQESPTTCSSSSKKITTAAILQQQSHQQQQQQQHSTTNSTSNSLTSVNNISCGRQIIIKIQLAKMENGNETSTLTQQQQQQQQDTSLESLPADYNLNSSELSTAGTQFLNFALNGNSMPNTATTLTTSSPSASALSRTAGSSLNKNHNYLNSNSGRSSNNLNCSLTSSSSSSSSSKNVRPERVDALQFNDEIVEKNIGEIVEYCEVLEDQQQQNMQANGSYNMQMLSINEEPDNEVNVCCRRKSKSLAANEESSMSSSNNTGAKAKSRCRKCSCRDAFRRFLDPSLSRSSNKTNKQQQQIEQKRPKSQDRHSNNPLVINMNKQQQLQQQQQQQQQQQHSNMHSFTTSSIGTGTTVSPAAIAISSPTASTATNHVSLWGPATATNCSDVIIPLTTPQLVVVQCAIVNPSNPATINSFPNTNTSSIPSLPNNILSIANDISPSTSSSNDIMVKVPSNTRNPVASTGPIVHSQVDFVHYLVPDLERITSSSFYWGKMDRYEAERLLEGKPEGTFLLRDSAQEEFLFSVTFRKYGRSLHARIEQSGHRFSFDCHDPCVFTAPTVTGLLEHYKDPACVMFFEPMLTIPLHRKNCFSLQKLCRATIVSHTTYDGINELELPARLKSYLKEYHYKQKLRSKSNEPTYTIHCK